MTRHDSNRWPSVCIAAFGLLVGSSMVAAQPEALPVNNPGTQTVGTNPGTTLPATTPAPTPTPPGPAAPGTPGQPTNFADPNNPANNLALNVTGPNGQTPFAANPTTGFPTVPEDFKGVKVSESSTTLSGKPTAEIPPQQPLSPDQQPAAGPLDVQTWTMTDESGNTLGKLPDNEPVAKPEFTEPKIYEIHNGGRRPVGQGGGDPKDSTGKVQKEVDVAGGAGTGTDQPAPKEPQFVPTSGWTKVEVIDTTPPNQRIDLVPEKTALANVVKFQEPGADEETPSPDEDARQDLHPGEKVFDLIEDGPHIGDLGRALSNGLLARQDEVKPSRTEVDVPLAGYPARTPMTIDMARMNPIPVSAAVAKSKEFYVPVNTRIGVSWLYWDNGDLDEKLSKIELDSSDPSAVQWTEDPDGLGGELILRTANVENPSELSVTLSFHAFDARGNSSKVTIPFVAYEEKVVVSKIQDTGSGSSNETGAND